MKVVLTGASGFIGRYVLDALNAAGIETITVGRHFPGNATSAHQHIQCDFLRDPLWSDLLAQAQGTHLLHCAWYAEHGKFWTSVENNRWVDASVKLVEAFCQQGGQRVVMVGTCAEYDWEYGWCSEANTPLNSATLYGCAKDVTRRLTGHLCRQNKVDFAWGRIFSPFGSGENEQRLIPALIRALRGEIPPMGINSDVYRDFLHASDVARGLVALLQNNAHGAYNISSGQPTSLADLATILAQQLDVDASLMLSMPPSRRDEVPLLVGNNRRLLELGWQPAMTLHAALERTLAEGFK